MSRIPLLLIGDGPSEPSGLGRIARDLSGLLATSDLPIDLVQVGGTVPPVWSQWRHLPLDLGTDWDWGASCVQRIWSDLWGSMPGILFIVWDPGRLLPYAQVDLPVQKWCYTAVDGANIHGQISGPAQHALRQFDRVLAYGRYGAEVLKKSLAHDVAYLPHGILSQVYEAPVSESEQAWVRSTLGPFYREGDTLVGCVATNQFRKDLGVYCQTLRMLLDRGRKVFGWLHTDTAVKAWAVQQLVEDFGLSKRIRVTIREFTDRQLAVLYQSCALTVLPSLGEGFGYPLVESLAAGVPVIHGDCGGGAELIPRTEWRVPVRASRLEGIYAICRPVFEVSDWANAVERCLNWKDAVGEPTVSAYCQGAIAHLDWHTLWPRWRSWFKGGLE